MTRFCFNNVFVKYAGKGYVVSGSGVANISVQGYCYHYKGDDCAPEEDGVEVISLEIESIEDLDLDEINAASPEACKKAGCKEATSEDLDYVCEYQDKMEDFCSCLEEKIVAEDCEFDEDDLREAISEQYCNDYCDD